MKNKKSLLIKFLLVLIDLLCINGTVYTISDSDFLNVTFLFYISFFWIAISSYTKFYNVYRYTKTSKLLVLLLSQFLIFLLSYLSYFTLFSEGKIIRNQFLIFAIIFILVTYFKFAIFFFQKIQRSKSANYKNIVLFGDVKSAENLQKLFDKNEDLGYKFYGFFSRKETISKKYLGPIKDGFNYVLANKIHEIYCDPTNIPENNILKIRQFAEKNNLDLTILPNNKSIYSKNFTLDYFGTVPILKPKPLPFEKVETHIVKRIFDIFFSSVVCLLILSWFIPILWIFIRYDSKGPLFFMQKRDGLGGKQFYCFKLRSMVVNSEADKISATKNDNRITKVGAFLRKTSLDELPQFLNVLLGDMSVVGPRPHINVQTEKYANEIDNYLKRHSVKPGITGLAQISGYRGEVIEKSDIKNRVRLDVFYIENWSFFLDVKIVIQTILNFFRKEEKAY